MARNKYGSPTLELDITPEQHERAVESASGGCLIADAIKSQYPELTGVTVDMATIRVTDRKKGQRYVYLTPPVAQHLLLSFDQGWPQSADHVTIKRAVKVSPITRNRKGPNSAVAAAERRAQRIAELEVKKQESGLTKREEGTLKRMLSAKPAPTRPTSHGPAEVSVRSEGVVVSGGVPIPQGPAHPNLLRGRDRHFGAKLADPGKAFNDAVEAAVANRLGQSVT